MIDNVLAISDLTKGYGDFLAVDGFNLKLKKGTVHGLVGPNGAGKSTMLSIISDYFCSIMFSPCTNRY